MADEAVLINVIPSDDEGLTPMAEAAGSSKAATPPRPTPKAKKRAVKRKNEDQASCVNQLPNKQIKSSNSADSDLQKAVSSLQQTVATLTNAFLHHSEPGSSVHTSRSQAEEILSEGKIPYDNVAALNLAPETGIGSTLAGNSLAPEKGFDTFTEGDLDDLLRDAGCQDDLLTEMAALIEVDEKESSALNDQLAKTVNALARGKIKPEKLEEKLAKYNKPSN